VAPTPSEDSPAARLRDARDAALAAAVSPAAVRAGLTQAADDWFSGMLAASDGVAVVAIGGYGRRELTPGSDLDVLLLHDGRSDVKELADSLWYPIWDARVSLDHSVRTVDEAASVARDDLKAALGLLDARHVTGDAELTARLRETVLAAWRRDARKRLPEVAAAVRDRAERHGELAFLLEPDLKECRGGLRDVHALFAAAAAWVGDAPGERVRAAATRLLDVRVVLHQHVGRPVDRLVLQEQAPIAAALGSADADALMRDVYAAGRAIAFASDSTWRRVEAAFRPPRRARTGLFRSGRPTQPERRPLADGVVEQDGEVVLARDVSARDDAVLVLRVAAAAAQDGLPIAPHTMERLVAESPPLPTPWPPAAFSSFVSLLGSGAALVPVVEALDQSGLWERLLPEWERVRCKPQRNAVHRFTVDRHLIEAVAEAAAFTRRVSRPDLLLVGALLHDIGKGFPGDHTDEGVRIVPTIASRLGMTDRDIEVLVTLVRCHLLLPDAATRRDLDDPATVQTVAEAVGDRSTLELLRALTEADALATGPAAWNDWKARLVDDLVARTSAVLRGEEPPRPELLDDEQLVLAEKGALAVAVHGDRVTVVAPDRPGLLWRWAGVLSLHRLTIRAATATSVGSTAVTVFDVTPTFGSLPDWTVVRDDLRRAYDDALPIAARLAERERAYSRDEPVVVPARVLWFDDASHSATVIEVRAHDRVGLLYRLTRALAEQGLDVRSARLTTLGAEVVDAFYVTDAEGGEITDPRQRKSVETALLDACRPSA
jgi:[protein-PII] uridylyltransferase